MALTPRRITRLRISAEASNDNTPTDAAITRFRSSLTARLGINAEASNGDILSAVDQTLARKRQRTAAATAARAEDDLYARAFGAPASDPRGRRP